MSERGPLGDLVEAIETYPTRRTSVRTGDRQAKVDAVAEAFRAEYDDVDTRDGVRVAVDDGWFLVRASETEPLVRVIAEAETAARADELFDRAVEAVERTRVGIGQSVHGP